MIHFEMEIHEIFSLRDYFFREIHWHPFNREEVTNAHMERIFESNMSFSLGFNSVAYAQMAKIWKALVKEKEI